MSIRHDKMHYMIFFVIRLCLLDSWLIIRDPGSGNSPSKTPLSQYYVCHRMNIDNKFVGNEA